MGKQERKERIHWVEAGDPAIVDLGKENLHCRQCSDQERERKAAGFIQAMRAARKTRRVRA